MIAHLTSTDEFKSLLYFKPLYMRYVFPILTQCKDTPKTDTDRIEILVLLGSSVVFSS